MNCTLRLPAVKLMQVVLNPHVDGLQSHGVSKRVLQFSGTGTNCEWTGFACNNSIGPHESGRLFFAYLSGG